MQRIISSAIIVVIAIGLSGFKVMGADTKGHPAGIGQSFKGPIGLQLYSMRFQFSNSVPATLDKVQKFGFKNVELAGTYGMTTEKFKSELAVRSLKAISGHFSYDRFKKEPEAVAREAKELGLQYAGCAWIPHEGAFDEQECRDAISVFNHAGEILAKQGIRFFYHTHGYEFVPHGDGTLFDLLMAETKPDYVRYEIDVFWILHPGQDPVKLMEKYGKRFELMHVKDMRKGIKGDLTGKSDVDNDVTLGTGQMNWPAILKAGKTIGIKWYFIEDESHFSERQIPQSLKFLEAVQF